MKIFKNNIRLSEIEIGEYFVYEIDGYYKKGLKVAYGYIIPIGLICKTIESAINQY